MPTPTPTGTSEQALNQVGDELFTLAGEADLKQATAALQSLTEAVTNLRSEIAKDDQTKAEDETKPPEGETNPEDEGKKQPECKGATAAKVLMELSKKAAELSAQLEGTTETEPVQKAVDELMGMLKSLGEKYPAPTAKSDIGGVAANALQLAQTADASEALTDDFITQLVALKEKITAVGQETGVEKAENAPALPAILSAEDPDQAQLVKGLASALRGIAERFSVVAKVYGSPLAETLDWKSEMSGALAMADKIGAYPTSTQKAAAGMSVTLREVAERALSLSNKAKGVGFNDPKAMREIGNIMKLLQGLVDKYAKVKKGDVDLGDLSLILNADSMLSQFEAELERLMGRKLPKESPVAPEEPKAVEKQGAAPDPEKQQLMQVITTLTQQVGELQTLVAKARKDVPPPASSTPEADPEDDEPLFPENYNRKEPLEHFDED